MVAELEKLVNTSIWIQILHGDDLILSGDGVLHYDTYNGFSVALKNNAGTVWIKEEKVKIVRFLGKNEYTVSYLL